MKENKNMLNILFSSNIINMVCKDIADNKTNIQVSELLIEELSELIRALVKLQRWVNGETTLRYNIDEIYIIKYEINGGIKMVEKFNDYLIIHYPKNR